MNYLAHMLLAGDDPDLRLGGLLADHVKGRHALATYPARVQAGIHLHRDIDRFTDQHPGVIAEKQRVPPPYRRYAGILLDVFFDHILARDWDVYSHQPLIDFSDSVMLLGQQHHDTLPDSLKRFMGYARQRDLLAAYAQMSTISDVMKGLSSRMKRANPLAGSDQVLRDNQQRISDCFHDFFPQLQAYTEHQRRRFYGDGG